VFATGYPQDVWRESKKLGTEKKLASCILTGAGWKGALSAHRIEFAKPLKKGKTGT